MTNPNILEHEAAAKEYLAGLSDEDLAAVTRLLGEEFVTIGWTDSGTMAIWAKQERENRVRSSEAKVQP